MSDKLTVEKERHGEATDATIEAVIAAERQRCINRVLTYAALRDQAAIDLDKAASAACNSTGTTMAMSLREWKSVRASSPVLETSRPY